MAVKVTMENSGGEIDSVIVEGDDPEDENVANKVARAAAKLITDAGALYPGDKITITQT